LVERASFSPDGKTLVTATDGELVFIDAADPSLVRMLPRLTRYDNTPAFLKGGERVVFAGRKAGSTRTSIYVVSVDGTGLKLLAVNGSNPVGSPDGRWIGFQRAGAIWLMHPDGSDQHRLTKGSDPCFSPDGKQLVFAGHGIERIAVDGRHLRSLTSQGGIPVWSPNGELIAYTHNDLQNDTSQLWVMPASGGKRTLLAHDQAVSEDALDYVGFLAPDWQPSPR
jgi:Tol biopolymer transport system component